MPTICLCVRPATRWATASQWRAKCDGTDRTGNDYRVLQPALVTDPNRNRTEVAFDTLGMVVGTAVMGKPEENLRAIRWMASRPT